MKVNFLCTMNATVADPARRSYGSPAEMSGLKNFSVWVQSWFDKIESDPVLIRKCLKIISPIQSWSACLKSCLFSLPHEAKSMLELFCLQPNTIGWRQNSSNSAFASWGKVDIAFWHFQNLSSQCLFCHQMQTQWWSYFAIRRVQLLGMVMWQGLCNSKTKT